MMDAIVLAGGRGTRLAHYVPDLPKPMAAVGGRPFLEHVLDHLIDCGVTSIVLSVGYRADSIEAHFGGRYRNVELRYAREEQPLGTGGAIVNAARELGDGPVLVVNGDTLLKVDHRDLEAWYLRSPTDIAMVLRTVNDVNRFGAAQIDGDRVCGFGEKTGAGPGLINAGVYVVHPRVLSRFAMPAAFSLEADLLQRHCAELRPRAYVTDAYFIDIGIPADLDRARADLREGA